MDAHKHSKQEINTEEEDGAGEEMKKGDDVIVRERSVLDAGLLLDGRVGGNSVTGVHHGVDGTLLSDRGLGRIGDRGHGSVDLGSADRLCERDETVDGGGGGSSSSDGVVADNVAHLVSNVLDLDGDLSISGDVHRGHLDSVSARGGGDNGGDLDDNRHGF